MEEKRQNKMATMPIGRLIATMALPAIIAMLIQALYNIVDSIFVAMISEKALLAVSLAFPLQMLLISVGVGTGVGLNSLISRRLGEKNVEEAGHAATHGIVLAVLSGLAFLILAVVATVPYFHAFTNDAEVFSGGCVYTRIVIGLACFPIVSMCAEKTIQATGNMLFPMIQNLAGAIVNIILDPIMIFGLFGFPKLGIAGAAIATVTGQFVSMAIGLTVLFRHNHGLRVTFRGFKFSGYIVRQIYQVGFPSIVMQAIASVMLTGMNAILNTLSATSVAVLGVYFKLQSFIFMPVFGLTQGAMPVMGYNYGARDRHRLMGAYKVTFIAAFCIMAVGTAIFWALPDKLLLMFSASDEMLEIGVPALRLISLSFIGAAFGIVNSTVFQAVGRGVDSLIVSVARQLVVILPVAFVLAKLSGLPAVWFAFPVAEIVSFLVSMALLWRIYTKELRFLTPDAGMGNA
ncbi:MATE family efflux transporter [Intestinibacillus massiliensis]|uniref:MATE family efflux transporter n=1 Tax=Intestinibacillus massiliensis TaxID=1871029 RepID=UPI000B35E761|nr:MATE family efflux transporter [Intestinibacillus massiliensis]